MSNDDKSFYEANMITMAKVVGTFYRELLAQGFTPEQALVLATALIHRKGDGNA
jgi:hypothetical protein